MLHTNVLELDGTNYISNGIFVNSKNDNPAVVGTHYEDVEDVSRFRTTLTLKPCDLDNVKVIFCAVEELFNRIKVLGSVRELLMRDVSINVLAETLMECRYQIPFIHGSTGSMIRMLIPQEDEL